MKSQRNVIFSNLFCESDFIKTIEFMLKLDLDVSFVLTNIK
jgi:hypothetical protein